MDRHFPQQQSFVSDQSCLAKVTTKTKEHRLLFRVSFSNPFNMPNLSCSLCDNTFAVPVSRNSVGPAWKRIWCQAWKLHNFDQHDKEEELQGQNKTSQVERQILVLPVSTTL
jgi:hypothetical protein